MAKAEADDLDDELYSWGSNQDGVLGISLPESESVSPKPSKVEFQSRDFSQTLKIANCSAGLNHAALLTSDQKLYVWGSNEKGELGLGDTESRQRPTLNESLQEQGSVSVSCGNSFTFLISGLNEIMISGKLPFVVQTEQGEE